MTEIRTAHYEGMFLLAQSAVADFAGAVQHIRDLLAKAGAEIVAMSKWDDRRFAYEIKRQKRGAYILVYFSCKTDALPAIERACNLSETILRSMITSAEHLTLEEMQATDAQQALADEASMRRDQAESEGSPEAEAVERNQETDQPEGAEQPASSS
jgi:small subunit ribosomal protein S6